MINLLKLSDLSRMDLIEGELRKFKFYDSENIIMPVVDRNTQDQNSPNEKKDVRTQNFNNRSHLNNNLDMWSFLLGRDFANFKDRSDFIFKMGDQEVYLHIKVHKLEKGKRLFVLVSDISRIKELETVEFKLMRMFFSSVAHELRTPLNSIIPMSKNLQNFVLPEGMIILKVIINSAHHLENVVNDALDIQRIENG